MGIAVNLSIAQGSERLGRAVARLRASARAHPDRTALVAVCAAVVLANLLYLLGIFDPNPLGSASHLYVSRVRGLLGGTNFADPNIAYTSQALGHRAAFDLFHLQLPWWNPYEATGVPLAGEMQSAALFPPTLLLILANGQIYEHVLLEMIGGCATYLVLRRLSVGRAPAAAGATAFALNGTFAWFAHAAANPVAFLPVLVLGFELAYDAAREGRRGGWWLIALAGALSLYAGFPETAYLDALLAGAWFLWRLGCIGRPGARALAAKAGAGAAAGALLSAPVLVPFVDYLQSANVGSHSGDESVHLASQALPQLVLPYVYGGLFQFRDAAGSLSTTWGQLGGYLTASLLLFALVGLGTRRPRGLRAILAAWIVLALARVYGLPALGQVMNLVPGMSSVQFHRLGDTSIELSVAVLAAFGLDALWTGIDRRRALVIGGAALAVIALAAVGASGLEGKLTGGDPGTYYAASIAVAAVAVLAGTTAMVLRTPRLRVRVGCVVLVAEVVVMFALPQLSAVRSTRTDLSAVDYLRSHLGLGRVFTLGPLAPNYGSYFGVPALNNNDLPLPANWYTYVSTRLDMGVNPFHFVGSKNGGRHHDAPSPESELIAHLRAYANASVRYVLTGPRLILPPPLRLAFAARDAWIYELPGAARYFSDATGGCRLSAVNRQTVRANCTTPSVLVRHETYMPGWSAQVDGNSVAVTQTGGLFQAVSLPAGSHLVSFDYAPPHILLAFLACLIGAGWLLIARRRDRRASRATTVVALLPAGAAPATPATGVAPAPSTEIARGPGSPRLLERGHGPAPAWTPAPPWTRRVSSTPVTAAADGPGDGAGEDPDGAPVDGRVEGIDNGVIAGWAWRPGRPHVRVHVRVLIDGELVAETTADLPRPSLKAAGIGDGCYGFRIALPSATGDGPRRLRIEVNGGAPLPPAAGFLATDGDAEIALDTDPRR